MFTADTGNPFKSLRYITLISTIKCKLAYALCSGNALVLQSSGPGSVLSRDDQFLFFYDNLFYNFIRRLFFLSPFFYESIRDANQVLYSILLKGNKIRQFGELFYDKLFYVS